MTMTTPILFKTDKFKLIYSDFRSRATIALFQFIDDKSANDSFLWIANVHLQGDPNQPNLRFNQMKNVLNKMTHQSNERKLDLSKISAVFAGDFNAERGEVIDDCLLNGGLKSNYRQNGFEDVKIIKNGKDFEHIWKCQSAYDNVKSEEERKKILTFYARNSFGCVDHIYFAENSADCLCCTESVPLWLSSDGKLQCPNDRLVSDHLPIAAMFEMKQSHKKYDKYNRQQLIMDHKDTIFREIMSF